MKLCEKEYVVIKQSAGLLAALAPGLVRAAADESHALEIVLPAIIIDYSGVALDLYRSQGVVMLMLSAAAVFLLALCRLAAGLGAPSAAPDPDARRIRRLWSAVWLLLFMALAVPALRVWAVVPG